MRLMGISLKGQRKRIFQADVGFNGQDFNLAASPQHTREAAKAAKASRAPQAQYVLADGPVSDTHRAHTTW